MFDKRMLPLKHDPILQANESFPGNNFAVLVFYTVESMLYVQGAIDISNFSFNILTLLLQGLYPGYIIFFVQSALMIAGSRGNKLD